MTVGMADQGSVVSQGDRAMGTDTARTAYGFDGTGITVGILSTSFDSFNGEDADKASHDLPHDTQILPGQNGHSDDEGRAMAQIVHDIAPGASILFATAQGHLQGGPYNPQTVQSNLQDFANNIVSLAEAGAKVIVDDFFSVYETSYQASVVTQAIADVVKTFGVTYITSAGNNGNKGYESPFIPGAAIASVQGLAETWHQFAPGQNYLPITVGVPSGNQTTATFSLQWDSPSASVSPGHGATADLDVFVYDSSGTIVRAFTGMGSVGGDAYQVFSLPVEATAETYYVRVGLHAGTAPDDFRIIDESNGLPITLGDVPTDTTHATSNGHHAAPAAISVGEAVYGHTPAYSGSPPTVDVASALGPSTITYDTDGTRLSAPLHPAAPALVGPDGVDTTFFGARDTDGSGHPNFFGTSAAAPHVAGLAALMLQANPALTSEDIRALLQDGAIDMDNPYTTGFDTGPDAATGAGFVQGASLGYAATGIITNDQHKAGIVGTHLGDLFVATAAHETFSGRGGADTVAGKAADLDGDTIADFIDADTIHVTDAGAQVYALSSGGGHVTFALSPDGSQVTTLALGGGAFSGSVHQHADARGGVDLTVSDDAAVADVFRFYDAHTNDHFFTANAAEADAVKASLPDYAAEGQPWATPERGSDTTDVFRFFDTATGTHFLTANAAERDAVIANLPSYRYEGVAFGAYAQPGTADTFGVERFYDATSHAHMYAAPDEAAVIRAGQAGPGWTDEGVAFIVHAAQHGLIS
ncbi:S8 family serine peptidase [Methylobacterium sp. J-076]|uniref:S8 family serine peptidase n=1 Tax=Methylobacterium sp. J-076 TaxID=2836655 RepID=UPI001FBB33CC|nr:S8 family serine peptidase [Methylobacterium sp. J-076]MCJ2012289.1 S8 family serine peptidase [Methylobacterium sp. J-076]